MSTIDFDDFKKEEKNYRPTIFTLKSFELVEEYYLI